MWTVFGLLALLAAFALDLGEVEKSGDCRFVSFMVLVAEIALMVAI